MFGTVPRVDDLLLVPPRRAAATPAAAQTAAVPPAAAALFSSSNRPKGQRRRSAKVVVSTSIGCEALLEIVRHCALLIGFSERMTVGDTAYLENPSGLEVLAVVTAVGDSTRLVIMHTGSRLADSRQSPSGSVRPLSDAVERTVRSIYPLASFAYHEE